MKIPSRLESAESNHGGDDCGVCSVAVFILVPK